MGKAKNRNAQRIANGQKPKPNVSGKSHKPFIGNAVFTMEDDAIIRGILERYPDTWTLAQIKDALPYSHTFKNITNYLQRLLPTDVINAHANMTGDPSKDDAQKDDAATSGNAREFNWTEHHIYETKNVREVLRRYFPQFGEQYGDWPGLVHERTGMRMTRSQIIRAARQEQLAYAPAVLRRYFPQFGEQYGDWPGLVHERTGMRMTRSQIIRAARQEQLAYAPADWTKAENELLCSDTATFVGERRPDTYVYDLFDYPRTHAQVLEQIANLDRRERMLKESVEEANSAIEQKKEPKRGTRPTTATTPSEPKEASRTVEPAIEERAARKEEDKEGKTMPTKQNANSNHAHENSAEAKNREDFMALSQILMNLSPDTEVHVNIKFANGLSVNFEKGAM